jgi:Outer membrane protein beta-barrel domain
MRTWIAMIAITTLSLGTAQAQESEAGAGRVEIGIFPVGGLFFGHYTGNTPNFGDYGLGTALAVNVNKWVAVEGEIGGGVGVRQEMKHNGVLLSNQQSPSMVAYNGDLIVNVIGSDRTIAPYVAVGGGGLTLLTNANVTNLGIIKNETYLTGNAGGGLKWYATPHIGVRGDFRLFIVKSKDEAPFFNTTWNQYGARVYGGLLLTY